MLADVYIKSSNSRNNFLRQNYTIASRDGRHTTFETSSRSLLCFTIPRAVLSGNKYPRNLVTIVHGPKQSNRLLTTPKNERSASTRGNFFSTFAWTHYFFYELHGN